MYTAFVILTTLLALALDLRVLRTNLALTKKFWVFMLIVTALQTVVDNYLNGRWWQEFCIVCDYDQTLFKLIETPVENYLYGFSLIYMVLSVYEFLQMRPVTSR